MKNRITLNAISSSAQVLVSGIIYFFLYRLLLVSLGIEFLGVWSIVLATSSLANLANFGITSSLTRHVALLFEKNEQEKLKELLFTASALLFFFLVFFGLIIFSFSSFILEYVIDPKFLSSAIEILPYSIFCLIINSLAGVYASTLEGFQKNYIKNGLFAVSSLILLAAAYLFVPTFGLLGVAYAQVIQAVFVFLSCLIVVLKFLPHNPAIWRWKKQVFKDLFSYGTQFQVISITNMLNEPLTKVFLAKFGGLEFIGFYEMANRLIIQLRSIVVSANQSLIPVMVSLESKREEYLEFYKKTFSHSFIFSIFSITLACLFSGIISQIWIGSIQPEFVICLIILGFGFLINLISGPSYFAYLAGGKLNNLLIGHIILSGFNCLFGFLLGITLHGYGVVAGWCLALMLSSVYIMYRYHKAQAIKIGDLIPERHRYLILLIILLILTYLLVNFAFSAIGSYVKYSIDAFLIFIFCVFFIRVFRSELTEIIKFGK